MGANSKTVLGAEAAGNLLYFAAENLTLVSDPSHPLYDERIKLPLQEEFVRNIMTFGVQTPVKVRMNGRNADGKAIVEVVFGRQRVRAVLEANKRLAESGQEPILVPAIVLRSSMDMAESVAISENENRRDDTPMVKARKLQRYLSHGHTEEEAAITFGVTLATIKNLQRLLDLHPAVQKAVENGMPINVAKPLSELPHSEQPAALEKLQASGNIKGARGVEAANNLSKGKEPESSKRRMMSRVAIETWRTTVKKTEGKDAAFLYAVLSRILGHERALSDYPKFKEMLE